MLGTISRGRRLQRERWLCNISENHVFQDGANPRNDPLEHAYAGVNPSENSNLGVSLAALGATSGSLSWSWVSLLSLLLTLPFSSLFSL